jgi:hypothetical protein
VGGPWIFPELNAAGWKYNKQYGIVRIPTQTAGGTVVAPLGGETWNIGNSGFAPQQNAAWMDQGRAGAVGDDAHR